MKKSNATAFIILIVAVIIVAVILLLGHKSASGPVSTPPVATGPSESIPQTLCYFSSTKQPSGYSDTYYMKLSTNDSGNASGELGTYPAEKDSMKGTLSGTLAQDGTSWIFDGTYANQAEGMTSNDERIIRLNATEAQIGYGETVQNADGSYSYKDKDTLNFSLSIPKVDCAQYDSLKAQASK